MVLSYKMKTSLFYLSKIASVSTSFFPFYVDGNLVARVFFRTAYKSKMSELKSNVAAYIEIIQEEPGTRKIDWSYF